MFFKNRVGHTHGGSSSNQSSIFVSLDARQMAHGLPNMPYDNAHQHVDKIIDTCASEWGKSSVIKWCSKFTAKVFFP
jgi:hypothetical protein